MWQNCRYYEMVLQLKPPHVSKEGSASWNVQPLSSREAQDAGESHRGPVEVHVGNQPGGIWDIFSGSVSDLGLVILHMQCRVYMICAMTWFLKEANRKTFFMVSSSGIRVTKELISSLVLIMVFVQPCCWGQCKMKGKIFREAWGETRLLF